MSYFKLKCTKFDFSWQTPLGELTALPRLDLRGPTSGEGGEEKGMGKGEEAKR